MHLIFKNKYIYIYVESKDQHVPSRGGMLIHTNPSSSQFWPVTFEMAGNIDQQKPRESDEMH